MERQRAGLARATEDRDVATAARIARLTDVAMLDPIVGMLVPGLGDIVTSGLGLYIVVVAFRKRLPAIVLARMLLNLGIDTVVGAIPIAGDLFDFAFRANRRNLELLRARHESRRSRPSDYLMVGGAALLFLAALAIPVLLLIWFVRSIA